MAVFSDHSAAISASWRSSSTCSATIASVVTRRLATGVAGTQRHPHDAPRIDDPGIGHVHELLRSGRRRRCRVPRCRAACPRSPSQAGWHSPRSGGRAPRGPSGPSRAVQIRAVDQDRQLFVAIEHLKAHAPNICRTADSTGSREDRQAIAPGGAVGTASPERVRGADAGRDPPSIVPQWPTPGRWLAVGVPPCGRAPESLNRRQPPRMRVRRPSLPAWLLAPSAAASDSSRDRPRTASRCRRSPARADRPRARVGACHG